MGSAREDISTLLQPVLEDSAASMELVGTTALALGMIFVGTADPDLTQTFCTIFMERDEAAMNVSHSRFLCLALGLLYLGKQEMADVAIETLKTISHPIGKYALFTVETCAYAGTGNVLKIQSLLSSCAEHLEDKNAFQGVAALGIALIAMGEEIGVEMAQRSFDHLLQ